MISPPPKSALYCAMETQKCQFSIGFIRFSMIPPLRNRHCTALWKPRDVSFPLVFIWFPMIPPSAIGTALRYGMLLKC